MSVKKTVYRPVQSTVSLEALVKRLTILADEALRIGYPFTAEHLKHIAAVVIVGERAASIGIARNLSFLDAFALPASNATSALPGWTTEVAICSGLGRQG